MVFSEGNDGLFNCHRLATPPKEDCAALIQNSTDCIEGRRGNQKFGKARVRVARLDGWTACGVQVSYISPSKKNEI